MSFLRRNRVPVVLVVLAVIVVILVGYRIKKQQAAAVPRRQVEIVVGVAKPVQKDLDVNYNIYTNNQFKLVAPMEDIVVRTTGPNGVPIHVKDLGTVADSAETQTAIVRTDGERAVFLRVNKQPGANTVGVVDQVKALMPKLIGIPPGVKLNITFDQSIYIRQAIQSSGTRRCRAPCWPSS